MAKQAKIEVDIRGVPEFVEFLEGLADVLKAAHAVGSWCDAYNSLPSLRKQRIYDLNRALRDLPPAPVPEEEKPDA